MKKGYTLAEVLITMGIIGVISAIMIPAIGNARPDKTKMMYLKMYDALSTTIMNLANDSSIYSSVYKPINGLSYNVEKYPLVNFAKPINKSYSSYNIPEDQYKLANLLRYALEEYDSTPMLCMSDLPSCSFKTRGNVTLTVEPSSNDRSLWKAAPTATSITFYNTIQMTIDNKVFNFYVTADGDVVPVDVQGQAYIKYRKKTAGKDSTVGLTAKTLADIGNGFLSVGGDSTKNIINLNNDISMNMLAIDGGLERERIGTISTTSAQEQIRPENLSLLEQ